MLRQTNLAFACCLASAVACLHAAGAFGQRPIGRTSATEVQVSGAVEVHQGEMMLGNGSTITASTQPVNIALSRGGSLRLCSTTSLHLAVDRSVADPGSTALMMALDRGALEAHYTVEKYSDVLLTPDLRILISGPGEADVSIRVNPQGDTCVDNRGAAAPYVTVSSQLEGGAYRVHPDQRVLFEHGSITSVVDREPEPCGCPPAPVVSVASAGTASNHPATPGQAVGGPSSTPADTAFPIAESEGLAPPPPLPTRPVVPAGETHAEVTIPLTYNGENPAAIPPADGSGANAPWPQDPAPGKAATPSTATATAEAPVPDSAPKPTTQGAPQGGLMHRLGRFFSHLFH